MTKTMIKKSLRAYISGYNTIWIHSFGIVSTVYIKYPGLAF